MSTVDVQPIEDYPALKMTWQRQVSQQDVAAAFRSIAKTLNTSDVPIYVVVDLLSNPNFPLVTTIQEALPAYRHPFLQEWLVVGSNWMAQTIEGALARITNHKNVRWFSSEADALDYMVSELESRIA